MSDLCGLWRREEAADLRQYRRDVARAETENYGFSWFTDRVPAEVVDALCWEDYESGHYNENELRIGAEQYTAVRDALERGAAQAEAYADSPRVQVRKDAIYAPAFREQYEETEAVMETLDDYMADIQAWRDVTDAWLDVAADGVERMYDINPFEAERRAAAVQERQDYQEMLGPHRLRRARLDRIAGEAKWDRDMQMFGAVKGGIWGGIAAMLAGLPVVGAGIGASGPAVALVPARKREAEQDAVGTVRADYRVDEMADRLDDPTLVLRPSITEQ